MHRLLIRHISQIFEKLLLASLCLSVRLSKMEQLGSHCTDFYEIWYSSIFLLSVKKIQVSLKSDNNSGTLHEGQCTVMIIFCPFLRIRNVSDTSSRENQNTHFCSIIFQWCRLWDNVATNENTATKRHSEYVILFALPQQKWLQENASMLRCTYIHYLSF